MCDMQHLHLEENQIGDLGVTALAKAVTPVSEGGSGALAQLQVSWRLTALCPHFEPWHARSLGLTVSFDVLYVPCADA